MCCAVLSPSVVSNSLQPHGLQPARLQNPLSMGFSRQEYWSGLPCPCPGDLPKPAIELASLTSPALAGEFFNATWEAPMQSTSCKMLVWMITSWNQGCWEKYQQPQRCR